MVDTLLGLPEATLRERYFESADPRDHVIYELAMELRAVDEATSPQERAAHRVFDYLVHARGVMLQWDMQQCIEATGKWSQIIAEEFGLNDEVEDGG
jgi:hypothetical protein